MSNPIAAMLVSSGLIWVSLTGVVAGPGILRPSRNLLRIAAVVLFSMVVVYGGLGLLVAGIIQLMKLISQSPEVRENGFWSILGVLTAAGYLWAIRHRNRLRDPALALEPDVPLEPSV